MLNRILRRLMAEPTNLAGSANRTTKRMALPLARALGVLALLLTPTGYAQTATGQADNGDTSESPWRVTTTYYMWLQGVHGDASALGRNFAFKASPSDLASNASFGYQGLIDVQYKRLIVVADSLWTPVSITKSSPSLLTLPEGVSATVKYTPMVFTQEAGYRVIDTPKIRVGFLKEHRIRF
jgi:hypothetical protein